jgi:signal transduction histidine kinase
MKAIMIEENSAPTERMHFSSPDEFLSIASHELKTPLTALKLHTEFQLRRFETDDPTINTESFRNFLRATQRQIDQLAHLIENMLDTSRMGHGKLHLQREPLSLTELATEILESSALQIQAAGCSYMISADGPARGYWDRHRLHQVITNLVGNAVKYGNKKPISLRISQKENICRLEVRDQGIGVFPEHLERIFERFERAVSNNDVVGLGLGLYICREIVEAHGGRIHAESSPGKGSRFIVELPSEL